jgi:uncharacterized OsmC-like protein
VTLEVARTGQHEFTGRNERGAEVRIGRRNADAAFSPSELLQLAVAGCAAVTAEELITRRTGENFRVEVTAEQRHGAHELDAIDSRFDLDLSALDEKQRRELTAAVHRAIDRLCTVSRTLARPTPVRESFPA